jgi:cysteinyl-tRNA synthetase
MSNKTVARLLNNARQSLKHGASDDIEQSQQQVADLQAQVLELKAELETASKRDAKNTRKVLEEAIKRYGISPVDELIRMVAEDDLSTPQRIQILKELAAYQIPKVKQAEHLHTHDHEIRVLTTRFGEDPSKAIDITPNQKALSR